MSAESSDSGLQPERTELAWRRTALTIGVGSLVALRILPVALGSAAWALVGVGGLCVSVAFWVGARRRYRRARSVIRGESGAHELSDGRMLAVLVGVVLAAGLFALLVVLRNATG